MSQGDDAVALLVFPRLRIQNVNIISSPMTWGFPSMTAFIGLMWALERKILSFYDGILLKSVGVVCHSFEPQISSDSFITHFNLTRNPLMKDGKSRPIVEEGRAHIQLTLVFSIDGKVLRETIEDRQKITGEIGHVLKSMRIAGGTIIEGGRDNHKPEIMLLDESPEKRLKQFKRLRHRWLPGSTLVLRDDLLQERLELLKESNASATTIDAWLDLSRISFSAHKLQDDKQAINEEAQTVEWKQNKSPSWIIPIPVGYAAISDLYPGGSVENSRDNSTPFRFVESLYSIGQWISPHRFDRIEPMLWCSDSQPGSGIYRCMNRFSQQANM